jgi:hypothetical protein
MLAGINSFKTNLLIMKRISISICFVFALVICQAQVSVRVRENSRGREVEINAKTNPSGNKGTNGGASPSETKTQPKTTPQTVPADTAAKPAATGKPDEGYSGPAKVSLKSFWRHLQSLRDGTGTSGSLNNAERMLKQVKEQDPNYDVAALETEVAGYRAQANKAAGDQKAAADKADASRNYFKDLYTKIIGIYSSGMDIQPGVTGKNYYDRVKGINFAEYQEKRKEAGEQGPNSYPVSIDKALADYDEYVKRADRMKWCVVAPMTKSRNAANPQEKTALLEEARYECEAILTVSPNNTPFKQKLDEVNKLLGAADAEAAKFYTSNFHKENLNTIVWSTQPLVIGKEKEMAGVIRKEFKTGDHIYGTAYLGVHAKEAMGGNTNLRVRIRIDGGTAVWGGDLAYVELPLAEQGKSYIQFALIPDAQWMKDNYGKYLAEENWTLSYLMDDLARSGDVSHAITCELIFPSSIVKDIKSEFALDLGAGSAEIKAMASKLHEQMMATRQLPKAGMNNPSLAKQCVDAANGLGWNDKFLNCIITSSAWNIEKNSLTGVILYRYVGAVCTIKGTDGKCYYQEFTFRQDYAGGGGYSSTVKYNSYGGKREIGCDKLK